MPTAERSISANRPHHEPSRSKLLGTALAYADAGIPVFPLQPCGKKPTIKDWPNRATTDRSRIHSWWNRWPQANIGIPTGKRSGLLVIDVDPGAGGRASLDRLEEERGITPTLTATTGGGGIHLVYRYPAGEIRNSAGKLAAGVDVRGEGGYIVAPPSHTEGPYRWLDRRSPADAPPWMVEELAKAGEKHTTRSVQTRGSRLRPAGEGPQGLAPADTGPIPTGERNDTLYRLACSWRAAGAEEEEIAAELERVNEARCTTPISGEELAKIARSASRYPAGVRRRSSAAAGEDLADVREALDLVEQRISRHVWRGVGGKSRRDLLVALLLLARRHGRSIPAGVAVTVGVRALALAAAMSKRSAFRGLNRLRAEGWIRRDDAQRAGQDAGTIVLLLPEPDPGRGDKGEPFKKTPRAKCHQSVTTGEVIASGCASGDTLRAPRASFTAPRLRWGCPTFERVGDEIERGYIQRLGKSAGQVLDVLEAHGGTLGLADLAELVGCKRPRDLRRRAVAKLEEAGVVECSGARVVLRDDWLESLERERERAGEHDAQRRDMARYACEREAWRSRRERPADPAPSAANMDRERERREQEREMVRLAEEERGKLSEMQYRALLELLHAGGRVATTAGPGRLWQVRSADVGVVLDHDPLRVTWMSPSELTGELVA